MLEELFHRFRQRDRQALSRMLSLAAQGDISLEQVAPLLDSEQRVRVVAFTGSGGVGKSSLIGKSIEYQRQRGRSVAVLACDPQSPLSGGALLGDRFRMGQKSTQNDDGVFIRSLPAISGHGAVADHVPTMIALFEAFGFDIVILETVGAGQGDVAVRALADVVVLLLQPEAGDDLQWEKAGVLEVADVIVVHKADLPGADQTLAQVRSALELTIHGSADGNDATGPTPVVGVSSKTGSGLGDLWDAIDKVTRDRRTDANLLDLLLQTLTQRYLAHLESGNDLLTQLLQEHRQGNIPTSEAIKRLLSILAVQ